jgi:predicted ATPase
MAEYHGFLAEIHWKSGRLDQALAEVDEALSIAERTNSRCYEAELHRIRGEVLLARSPDDEGTAEACFRRSIEVARSQAARSWELRGGMSLGKLRHRQGRTGEAEQILSQIYQRFTQGFETPDLRDARALLEGWSRG